MKKIKVLFHTQPNSSSFNAQDLNGKEIASRLNDDIFEIYFIDTLGTRIDEKLKKDNIKILKTKYKNKFLKKLEILRYKLLQKYNISFYVRVFRDEKIFLNLLPFLDFKRKTIHMVENLLPYPNSDKKYQVSAKYNALHSTKVYSISKAVQASVKKEYGLNTEIIPVGVDTSLFKPIAFEEKDNKRLKIVSVGTFQKRKQPDLFASIAKIFPESDFYWAGEGELKPAIEKKKKDEAIENLYLLGNMEHDKLSKFMATCDIFLFPSIHEGFPKVIIEAMASGLPVIAFSDYNPEAILDNQTGYIVSTNDDMKEKLSLLIHDKALRDRMSKEAIRRAHEFDWNIITKNWEKEMISMVMKKNK